MAVWIDETGTLVRPAEGASIQVSTLRSMEIPADLPERTRQVLTEMKNFPDTAEAYRAAIVDWANRGAVSPYALSPEDVVERSQPRSADHSRAAACFELGHHLHVQGDHDAAIRGGRRRTPSSPRTGHTSARPGRWSRPPRAGTPTRPRRCRPFTARPGATNSSVWAAAPPTSSPPTSEAHPALPSREQVLGQDEELFTRDARRGGGVSRAGVRRVRASVTRARRVRPAPRRDLSRGSATQRGR